MGFHKPHGGVTGGDVHPGLLITLAEAFHGETSFFLLRNNSEAQGGSSLPPFNSVDNAY